MPIYEFYCEDCNTIFNFFSKRVNTTKRPLCPSCKQKKLSRQMSTFASLTGAKEEGLDDLPIDEAKMEKAMSLLAREAEGISVSAPSIGVILGIESIQPRLTKNPGPQSIQAPCFRFFPSLHCISRPVPALVFLLLSHE